MATWVDGQGKRWLFVPMYGPTAKDTVSSFPKSYGPVVNGSLMAFTVQLKNGKPILVPEWNSGDLDLPGTPGGSKRSGLRHGVGRPCFGRDPRPAWWARRTRRSGWSRWHAAAAAV